MRKLQDDLSPSPVPPLAVEFLFSSLVDYERTFPKRIWLQVSIQQVNRMPKYKNHNYVYENSFLLKIILRSQEGILSAKKLFFLVLWIIQQCWWWQRDTGTIAMKHRGNQI